MSIGIMCAGLAVFATAVAGMGYWAKKNAESE